MEADQFNDTVERPRQRLCERFVFIGPNSNDFYTTPRLCVRDGSVMRP